MTQPARVTAFSFLSDPIVQRQPFVCAANAVSYTHLDVYKRQAVRIGEEATLKHFHRQGDTVMLLADNAAVCPPMVYTLSLIHILLPFT